MIKYLGSKRRLVPVIAAVAAALRPARALDLFCGTTRVAQCLKAGRARVTAVDATRCAHLLARTYVETDGATVDGAELRGLLAHLASRPGVDGYVTDVFCRRARFFHPDNGRRIDAVLAELGGPLASHPLRPIALTALIEGADRVDSTTGVQMAFLKEWAPRAHRPLELRAPALLPGEGRAVRGDAAHLGGRLGSFDLAYLDPPYNQHRYDANYHVWETIIAGDQPSHYGVACKRSDLRDATTRSAFNSRRTMPAALAATLAALDAEVVLVSHSDEAWVALDDLLAWCSRFGAARALAFESARDVGARIGVHDPAGRRVGEPGRLRNVEYLVVAGPGPAVDTAVAAALAARPLGATAPAVLAR